MQIFRKKENINTLTVTSIHFHNFIYASLSKMTIDKFIFQSYIIHSELLLKV